MSSSSDCERESSPVGVKNEENEGNFKDISLTKLLGVDARAHTHTHTHLQDQKEATRGGTSGQWSRDRAYRLFVIDTNTGLIVASIGRDFRRKGEDDYETRGGVVPVGDPLLATELGIDFQRFISNYKPIYHITKDQRGKGGGNNKTLNVILTLKVDTDHFGAGPKGAR